MRHLTQPVVKFLYQARFAQPRLADNHHQLPVASPCALPAARQHGDFLVTPDKRREVALARAASTAACPDEPEQCHWLRHAFEFIAAALLGDKQSGYLTPHLRRNHDRAWFGQRLRPRRDVRDVAEYLTRCVDNYRPGVDRYARGQCWLAGASVFAVQLSERALDSERSTRRALGVVLLR